MTKDEALDLAMEALEYRALGVTSGGKDLDDRAITAIKQARALDKKADNARELGLDYEPADGTQVSKVWWDGEKLMAKPIPLVDFYQPVQDSTCSETLRAQGKAYPRTCRKCGKGPCIGAPKPPPAQPAPVQEPFCFYYVENGEEYFAPKGAYVPDNAQPLYTTLPAAQPAVPDAMTSADIQEHIEYVAGWNDCRQAMLEILKARGNT
jgi:hypothetical protein